MWAMQTCKKGGFQDVSVFCPPTGVGNKGRGDKNLFIPLMFIFYLYVTDSVENANALLTARDNQERQGSPG